MGHLTATIDTKTLRGSVERTITVRTNDPDPRGTQFFLTVKANVVSSVSVLPSETLSLGTDALKKQVTRLVRKDPTESGTLAITEVKSSAPWMVAAVRRVEEAAPPTLEGIPAAQPGDYILELRIDGHPSPGKHQEFVEFKTGLTRQPTIHLDIPVYSQPVVNLTKDALVLDRAAAAPGGKGAEEQVVLVLRKDVDPSELKAEANLPALKVALERLGERQFKLKVRWEGGTPTDGVVTFKVGEEAVYLPVRWSPS